MFLLIVEDDINFTNELGQMVNDLNASATLSFARSRESALHLLQTHFFDLIVLDLKIPTIDGALDAEPEHGHAVFAQARAIVPGTPIFVLTGSPTEDFVSSLLDQHHKVDIWGQGQKTDTITLVRKIDLDDCPTRLKPIVDAVFGLNDIELSKDKCELIITHDRLIRIFCRRVGGACCQVSLIGGGLSGAKVMRLHVTDVGGATLYDAIAKLGSPEDIQRENECYDKYVNRLDTPVTPRKLVSLEFGAGSQAGIFYGLAKGYEKYAFSYAFMSDGSASSMIKCVESATRPWIANVPHSQRTIRDVRRRVLSDEDLKKVVAEFRLSWITEFESRKIQTRWSCIHGDLHGFNILSESKDSIVVIDYGDVGDGPASLDPVTLELSLSFHPDGPLKGTWPLVNHAQHWGTTVKYLEKSPAAEFILECRGWAVRVAAGKREIAASAYSYLMRQLKYPDTHKDLALALLEAIYAHYNTDT